MCDLMRSRGKGWELEHCQFAFSIVSFHPLFPTRISLLARRFSLFSFCSIGARGCGNSFNTTKSRITQAQPSKSIGPVSLTFSPPPLPNPHTSLRTIFSTLSAIPSDDVNPGDSIPSNEINPCCG